MKYKLFFPFLSFCCVVLFYMADFLFLRANHGFAVHLITAPIPLIEEISSKLPLPISKLDQPFYYLNKGAQSFVFESKDHSTVIKFYRFPSSMRRFPWVSHPIKYLFSDHLKRAQASRLKKFKLTMESFLLAESQLQEQTGVLYLHLQPTDHIKRSIHLIDALGYSHYVPLDSLVFAIQKKGICFLSLFKSQLLAKDTPACQKMIASLIKLIVERCQKGIADLDHMEKGNYGWLDGRAIHLDLGTFQEKAGYENVSNIKQEVERVTTPIARLLALTDPDLYQYYLDLIEDIE